MEADGSSLARTGGTRRKKAQVPAQREGVDSLNGEAQQFSILWRAVASALAREVKNAVGNCDLGTAPGQGMNRGGISAGEKRRLAGAATVDDVEEV